MLEADCWFLCSSSSNLHPSSQDYSQVFLAEPFLLLALPIIDMTLHAASYGGQNCDCGTCTSEKVYFKKQGNAHKFNCYGCKERLLQNVSYLITEIKERYFRNVREISEAFGKEKKTPGEIKKKHTPKPEERHGNRE